MCDNSVKCVMRGGGEIGWSSEEKGMVWSEAGHASCAPPAFPSNYVLHDQLVGLRSVQENILQYGGNPYTVVVGQATGTASFNWLLLSLLAKGP